MSPLSLQTFVGYKTFHSPLDGECTKDMTGVYIFIS